MPSVLEILFEKVFGKKPRGYSTCDFGREKDDKNLSVVVPEDQAKACLPALRQCLPPGHVAFIGTTRWLGDERHDGVEVVIGKATSQFDILRIARSDACNYNLGTEDLIEKLKAWDHQFGIDIFQAETDTIQMHLLKLPEDLKAFAKDVYDFCPDVVDQGVGTADALEEAIESSMQVYLWWD